MSGFDYANARLRAMKSRLLSRRALEGLVEAGSVPGLLTALAGTPYREAVEAGMARAWEAEQALAGLAEALRRDLELTVGRARRFFAGDERAECLAAVALRRYDLHNVKAVLRGLASRVPAAEILAATLPAGDLRSPELAELARAVDVRAAIDLLATWRVPLARPLLAAGAGHRAEAEPGPSLELALERWHTATALEQAAEAGDEGRPLAQWVAAEADRLNILTALRLAGEANLAAALRQHAGGANLEDLFVGPGRISKALLVEAAGSPSIAESVAVLRGTPFGPTLERVAAAPAAAGAGLLSAFERALVETQLRQALALLIADPLGLGVLLGYLALKTNEVANLRVIGYGLARGEKPDRIRADLLMVED